MKTHQPLTENHHSPLAAPARSGAPNMAPPNTMNLKSRTIKRMNRFSFAATLGLVVFAAMGHAGPLDTWTWRNSIPAPFMLNAIVYGDGQFLAVGESGLVVTSSDGTNWDLRPSGSQSYLDGIAYGNDKFVAIGYDYSVDQDTILTSVDGINWVQRHLATQTFPEGVVYGNGKFVAVNADALLTSADGTNWTQSKASTNDGFSCIAFGQGEFVAADSSSSSVLTSTDGINWVVRQVGTNTEFQSIAYGNGQFVGALGSALATSSDGANWVLRQTGTNAWLRTIGFGNGQFVVAGYDSSLGEDITLTSTDAVNWVQHRLGLLDGLSAIAYGNGQFVAAGGIILTSADGASWTQQGDPDGVLKGIAYGNGQFVAVGRSYPDTANNVMSSADGVSWSRRQTITNVSLNAITYGEGQFVAVGFDYSSDGGYPLGGAILTSTDAVNWVQRQARLTNALNSVVYGNGLFLATSVYDGFQERSDILTSTDGLNWVESQSSPPPAALEAVTYGIGQFVAVGDGPIWASIDGSNWVGRQVALDAGQHLHDIAYGKGQLVAVGGHVGRDNLISDDDPDGIILTSTDGTNWVHQSWPDHHMFVHVAYGGGLYVATDYAGGVISSVDGIDWVQRVWSNRGVGWQSAIAYGNGHFVTVGERNAILESGIISTLALTSDISSGRLSLSLEGPVGLAYTIQSSADLVSWQIVTNITSVQPTTVISDAQLSASKRLFYRAYTQ